MEKITKYNSLRNTQRGGIVPITKNAFPRVENPEYSNRLWSHMRNYITVIGLTLLTLAARPALARPAVEDGAHVLSSETVAQIQEIDDEIHRATGKDLLVVSAPTLNGTVQQAAASVFRQERLDGLLVYFVPNAKKLEILPGRNTQVIFPQSRLTEIRQAMLPAFKGGNFNQGVLAGADGIRTTLLASAPARTARPARTTTTTTVRRVVPVQSYPQQNYQRPVYASRSHFGLDVLLFFIVGLLIFIAVIRMLGRMMFGWGAPVIVNNPGGEWNAYGQQPNMMGGGYPMGGGPGLAGTFAAGVGGAIVGDALYDSMTGRNQPYYDQQQQGYYPPQQQQYVEETTTTTTNSDAGPAWSQSDAGDPGVGDSSSWGDSGGGADPNSGGDWS
jgi:uncharacterized membrane protein YgcG